MEDFYNRNNYYKTKQDYLEDELWQHAFWAHRKTSIWAKMSKNYNGCYFFVLYSFMKIVYKQKVKFKKVLLSKPKKIISLFTINNHINIMNFYANIYVIVNM